MVVFLRLMTDKREKILNAALKLFIEKGFQNTSTANISKEAGVATGTLFIYFPGKDALINELYKYCKGQMGDALQSSFQVEGTTEEMLRFLWHGAINWALNNLDAFRFIHMFKSSPLISNLTREEVSSSADFAMKFFQDAVKKGEIAKIDIELLLAIIDSLMSATVSYIATNMGKNKKQIIERGFTAFWNGMQP
jgi:AcrR family transcriptional regulator